jgi:hypothetical protein
LKPSGNIAQLKRLSAYGKVGRITEQVENTYSRQTLRAELIKVKLKRQKNKGTRQEIKKKSIIRKGQLHFMSILNVVHLSIFLNTLQQILALRQPLLLLSF